MMKLEYLIDISMGSFALGVLKYMLRRGWTREVALEELPLILNERYPDQIVLDKTTFRTAEHHCEPQVMLKC